MKKPSVAQVQNLQSWFCDYLKTEVDPYDFGRYIPEWASDTGIRLKDADETPHDLKPAQLKKFEQWLIANEKGIDWVSTGDIYAPAYLFFNEVSKLPRGTWGIHFTDSDAFSVFEQGTTIEGLALSSHKKNKDTVDCRKNVTDDIGIYEVVFGFAFPADERNVLQRGTKYGSNAVLFQTDGAVRAWHIGDEEYQMIFPLCSEYNVIPLHEAGEGISCAFGDSEEGEGLSFDSIQDLIAYIEKSEKEGERPLERLRC